MERVRKVFLMVLVMIMAVTMKTNVAAAGALPEVATYSTVTVKATVPEGFNETIAFALQDEETQVKHAVALTPENDYTGTVSMVGGYTYLSIVVFPGSENYKINIAEKYEIDGLEVELEFDVTPITYSAEAEGGSGADHGSDAISASRSEGLTDSETGLEKAENVLETFQQQVAFMQDDPNFASFLGLYSGAMFEKYYLEADPMNTKEQWEEMTQIERFNYYITFYMPYVKMMNYEFDSADKFVEELVSQKTMLGSIEKGDIVYNAIVDVWEWHYSYWQHTGMFYNFFNENDVADAGQQTEPETVRLTDRDAEELKEIESELGTEMEEIRGEIGETEKEGNSSASKGSWLIVLILLAAVCAFVFVYSYNRKKNISDNSSK